MKPAEVVLVDDGNTDETIQTLRDIERTYASGWVKIVSLEQNAGAAAARNAGWDAATQPYIAFLDADDAWHPRKLEIQYSWMCDHPEVALTGHTRIRGEGPWPAPSEDFRAQQIGPRRLLFFNILPTSSVMLRRKLASRFDPSKQYSEDYLLWLQIVMSGCPVFVLDLPLARMYKSAYGDAGLSRNLWAMEREELANYRRLRDGRMISKLMHSLLVPYSVAKFLRRVCYKAGAVLKR